MAVTLQLLAVLAGFAMIIAATMLAFRQAMTWQHVVIFCLGGVLAGISGIRLEGGASNWSVSIGQLKEAADNTSSASLELADAIAALSTRVDQIQAAMKQGATPPPIASAEANAVFLRSLNSSRNFSRRARDLSSRVPNL